MGSTGGERERAGRGLAEPRGHLACWPPAWTSGPTQDMPSEGTRDSRPCGRAQGLCPGTGPSTAQTVSPILGAQGLGVGPSPREKFWHALTSPLHGERGHHLVVVSTVCVHRTSAVLQELCLAVPVLGTRLTQGGVSHKVTHIAVKVRPLLPVVDVLFQKPDILGAIEEQTLRLIHLLEKPCLCGTAGHGRAGRHRGAPLPTTILLPASPRATQLL